jgi:hypothetical protein
MSKILLFTFENGRPRGGFNDLACILESDNREGHLVLDAEGYLLPSEVVLHATRKGLPGQLQALHLSPTGQPDRMETWQRVPLRDESVAPQDVVVTVVGQCSYWRVSAGACRLALPEEPLG